MNRYKKIILTISCWLFAILVICTFLATSISNALVAKADVVAIKESTISQSIDVQAKRSRTVLMPIYAKTSGVLVDDIVLEGQDIEVGTPIYQFDSAQTDITAKQALLAISNIEQQIKQTKLIDTQIEQHKINLKTAENELATLENKQTMDTQHDKLIGQIQSLQNSISSAQVNDFTSRQQLSAQLSLAWQQLYAYEGTASEQINQLIKTITDLEASITSGTLTQEELDVANRELYTAMLELGKLNQGGTDIERTQLRMQIDELASKLRLSEQQSITSSQELSSQLIIAQREMELFEKNTPINQQSELNRATAAIIQAKEQLDTATVQKSAIKGLQLQLDIAKEQLALHQKLFPQGGIYNAPFNGTIYRRYKTAGDTVAEGDMIMELYTSDSKRSIEYRLPNAVGGEYPMGSRVDINYRVFTESGSTKIVQSSMKTMNAKVSRIVFDEETNEYIFHASYEGTDEIPKETTITAKMHKLTTVYDMTVPASAIFRAQNGDSCVYVTEIRDSLFKQEHFARMVPVRVIDTNNIICAITSNELKPGDKVIQYLSKSIYDGDRVNVQG